MTSHMPVFIYTLEHEQLRQHKSVIQAETCV